MAANLRLDDEDSALLKALAEMEPVGYAQTMASSGNADRCAGALEYQ
jgi:hypothetical protein